MTLSKRNFLQQAWSAAIATSFGGELLADSVVETASGGIKAGSTDRAIRSPDRPFRLWASADSHVSGDLMPDRYPIPTRPPVAKLPRKSLAEAIRQSEGYNNLADGAVRARYRESDETVSLLEPGRIYKYTIDLDATSHVFAQGHRIRLQISSSNFPRISRNLNTGADNGMTLDFETATQTIYHDRKHPSHVTLPVVSRP